MSRLIFGAVTIVRVPVCAKCKVRPIVDEYCCWCPLCVSTDDVRIQSQKVERAEKDLAHERLEMERRFVIHQRLTAEDANGTVKP